MKRQTLGALAILLVLCLLLFGSPVGALADSLSETTPEPVPEYREDPAPEDVPDPSGEPAGTDAPVAGEGLVIEGLEPEDAGGIPPEEGEDFVVPPDPGEMPAPDAEPDPAPDAEPDPAPDAEPDAGETEPEGELPAVPEDELLLSAAPALADQGPAEVTIDFHTADGTPITTLPNGRLITTFLQAVQCLGENDDIAQTPRITLNEDITLTAVELSNGGILLDKPVVIDGNGKLLTAGTSGASCQRLFNVASDGVVLENMRIHLLCPFWNLVQSNTADVAVGAAYTFRDNTVDAALAAGAMRVALAGVGAGSVITGNEIRNGSPNYTEGGLCSLLSLVGSLPGGETTITGNNFSGFNRGVGVENSPGVLTAAIHENSFSDVKYLFELAESDANTYDLSRNYCGGRAPRILAEGQEYGGDRVSVWPYYRDTGRIQLATGATLASEIADELPGLSAVTDARRILVLRNLAMGRDGEAARAMTAAQRESLDQLYCDAQGVAVQVTSTAASMESARVAVRGAGLLAEPGQTVRFSIGLHAGALPGLPSAYEASGAALDFALTQGDGSALALPYPLEITFPLPDGWSRSGFELFRIHAGTTARQAYTVSQDGTGTLLTFATDQMGAFQPAVRRASDSSEERDEDPNRDLRDFWYDVMGEIEQAEKGAVLQVDARSYDSLYALVLERLKGKDVTLEIEYRFGTLRIHGTQMQPLESGRIYYDLEELAKAYRNAAQSRESGSVPAVPPTAAPAVQTPVISAVQTVIPPTIEGTVTAPTPQVSSAPQEEAASTVPEPLPPPETATVSAPAEPGPTEFVVPAPPAQALSTAQEKRLLYATVGAVIVAVGSLAACVFVIVRARRRKR